jgi:Uma2 family endonuclease
MSTILKLGPADHDRRVTEEELAGAHFQEGYRYEIIEGRLYVSPTPNFPHDRVVTWIASLLKQYSAQHPVVTNYVTTTGRIPSPTHPDLTVPEPDVAAFQGVDLDRPPEEIRWEDLQPILVVEVVSEDTADKDFVRNLRLYRMVPAIREYWIFDPRQGAFQPTLYVYRRRGTGWQTRREIAPGGSYTTPLLPEFHLTVDPRA